jgi:hypothetical protein
MKWNNLNSIFFLPAIPGYSISRLNVNYLPVQVNRVPKRRQAGRAGLFSGKNFENHLITYLSLLLWCGFPALLRSLFPNARLFR